MNREIIILICLAAVSCAAAVAQSIGIYRVKRQRRRAILRKIKAKDSAAARRKYYADMRWQIAESEVRRKKGITVIVKNPALKEMWGA